LKIPVAGPIKTIWQEWGRHIFEQTFTFPDGRQDDFFVFDTTKTIKPIIVFPLTENHEVIGVRQFRYGANAVVLESPGGLPKPGETAEETLLREFVEETGYQPKEIVPFKQKTLWFEPASLRVQCVPLLALGCTYMKKPRPDETEVMEVMVVPYEEWVGLIADGTIQDDKTIAITFLADLYFRRNPR
jgi:ADP-ribose pyrophosphatase